VHELHSVHSIYIKVGVIYTLVTDANTVDIFKLRLDKFWKDQDVYGRPTLTCRPESRVDRSRPQVTWPLGSGRVDFSLRHRHDFPAQSVFSQVDLNRLEN